MEHSLYYEVKAHISFTDEEFDCIWEHCKQHYSDDVKSLIKQGGRIYGHKNMQTLRPGAEYNYSNRDIETIAKALEHPREPLAVKIYSDLRKIYSACNEAWRKVNQPQNETETETKA